MYLLYVLIVVLVGLLVIAGIFSTLVGLVTLVQFARNKKLPMDESNRINHIRLWWFALTRPELFVAQFEWLTRDELDNITK